MREDEIGDYSSRRALIAETKIVHIQKVAEMKAKQALMREKGELPTYDPSLWKEKETREKRPNSSAPNGLVIARQMNLVLAPYGENTTDYKLRLPYISLLSTTLIRSLKAYLLLKFPTVDSSTQTFTISTFVNSEHILFAEDMMVKDIHEKYWDTTFPDLRVYYTLQPIPFSPLAVESPVQL